MTEPEAVLFVRRIYLLALGFGVFGSVSYFSIQGWRPALGFALGALGSFGNLWLYERITRSIQPSPADPARKNGWQGLVLIGRYFIMIAVAYAIVKTLGVNALAVILGLLTSTAAVLTSTVIELLQSFFVNRSSH